MHDARFEVSLISFNNNVGLWKGRFEREFLEDKELITNESKLIIFNKVTVPLIDSELTLKGIKNYKINDKSKINRYTFNECKIVNNIVVFKFCEDMDITLIFEDEPRGRLIDFGLLNTKSTFYHFRNPFKKNANKLNSTDGIPPPQI